MADGNQCRFCGRQETTHILKDDTYGSKRYRGYKRSLKTCPGFDTHQSTRVDEEDENAFLRSMEREANFNVAWGRYGSVVRTQNFSNELARKNKAIRNAGSEEKKKAAVKNRDKFVEKCEAQNQIIHVGFY